MLSIKKQCANVYHYHNHSSSLQVPTGSLELGYIFFFFEKTGWVFRCRRKKKRGMGKQKKKEIHFSPAFLFPFVLFLASTFQTSKEFLIWNVELWMPLFLTWQNRYYCSCIWVSEDPSSYTPSGYAFCLLLWLLRDWASWQSGHVN